MAVAGVGGGRLQAQEVKINLGGASAEQVQANQALASKLPPTDAAAYLRHQAAWATTGETLQWLGLVALPLGIVALVLTFRHRRQKLAHETMRLLIEKGAPVPPELLNPPPPVRLPSTDLRKGMIWLAIGLALAVATNSLLGEFSAHLWTLGLAPAFIGAAYLMCWGVSLAQGRRFSLVGVGTVLVTVSIGMAVALNEGNDLQVAGHTLDDYASLAFVPMALGAALLLLRLIRALAEGPPTSPWLGLLWTTVGAAALLVCLLVGSPAWKFCLIPLALTAAYLAYWFVTWKRSPPQLPQD